MASAYFVTERRCCDNCAGEGKLADPLGIWAAFDSARAEFERARVPDLRFEDWASAWWSAQGFPGGERPPRLVVCMVCRGRGMFTHDIEITEVIEALERQRRIRPLLRRQAK